MVMTVEIVRIDSVEAKLNNLAFNQEVTMTHR